MLKTDFFKGNDKMMVDEVVTFFFAGMKTIQISTTNLIYNLTKHPEIRAKLFEEIRPPVDSLKGRTHELDYETVMEFDYLQMCYSEALRMEPPAANSIEWLAYRDYELTGPQNRKYHIKKDTRVVISYESIMNDPYQWIEPEVFQPLRFDKSDPESKWVRTEDGKPRNPLAFTPFMGGKRVCLGKTFAEVTVRFTVPLLYHFFDFEFADESFYTKPKQQYTIGGKEELDLPMKLTIRNVAE